MKICAVEDGNLDFTRRSGAKWEDDNPKLTSLTLQKKSLHWELQYAADVYVGPSDQGKLKEWDCIHCTFRLVPLRGASSLQTVDYSLELQSPDVGFKMLRQSKLYQVNRLTSPVKGRLSKLEFCIRINMNAYGGAAARVMPRGAPVHGIRRLHNNGDHSDFTVQCGDRVVKVHKNILASHSQTLRAAIDNESFVEGKTGVYKISEEAMSPDILEDVLKWMYLQGIDNPASKVVKLLEAANYFQMEALEDYCKEILINTLSVANCLELLILAYKYNITPLKSLAAALLVPNKEQALQANAEKLPDALTTIPKDVLEVLGIEPTSPIT